MQLPSISLLDLLLAIAPLFASAAGDSSLSHSQSQPGQAFATRGSSVRIGLDRPSSPHDEEPHRMTADHVYNSDIVVRFNVSTVAEERTLVRAAEQNLLDVWSWDQTVDFRIDKNRLPLLLELLPDSLREGSEIVIEDLSLAILNSYPSAEFHEEWLQDKLLRAIALSASGAGDADEGLYFFRNFQPPHVVLRWMRLIESMFPSFVRFTAIGQSFEGRDIPALIISVDSDAGNYSMPRKTLVVMGGSHAREWISTATVNYLTWALITAYGKDKFITKFLKAYDIVFIPEMNPDGIEYTWSNDRLWRKSRQPTNISPKCLGLDLDHAFGYRWKSRRGRQSNDPCSESYAGQKPWESIEVSAFRDWAKREAETKNIDFVGLVDLHSYSQQILYPYAYTCSIQPPNRETMEELALGLAKSIRLLSGETYSVKPACQGVVPGTARSGADGLHIEPSGGRAIDWFYHELGAHYSYQIKLRDTGSYGFLLPPDQIIPTGEEILHALRYLGDFLLGNDGIENVRLGDGAEAGEKIHAEPADQPKEMIPELKKRDM